jgi:hypothetical protein
MGFKLRIVIDGLCAFVPNKTRTRMKVLLLNSMTPEASGAGMSSGMSAVPYHYPTLRIPRDYYSYDYSTPYRADFQTDDYLNFFIAWEDIFIRYHHGYPLYIFNGRRPGSVEPSSPREERDFSWVVEVAQVYPDAVTEPLLLTPSPPRNLLMGRLNLDHGNIRTAEVAKYGGRNVIFEFAYGKHYQPITFTQAMATKVLYSLKIPHDWVDLCLVRFGDGGIASRERTIRICAGDSDRVTLQLRNVPLEDLLGLPPTDPSDLGLGHYGVLYRTLHPVPEDPPIPRPLFEPFTSRGLATGATTICTGHTLNDTDFDSYGV